MTHHDTTAQMLRSHPAAAGGGLGLDPQVLADCIDACTTCAQACTACADACLGEEMVAELRRCIRTDLDCADVCDATGRVLSRLTPGDLGLVRSLVQACADACRACDDECEQHAGMHEHCRVCAEACRRCEAACRRVLEALSV